MKKNNDRFITSEGSKNMAGDDADPHVVENQALERTDISQPKIKCEKCPDTTNVSNKRLNIR